MKKIINHTALLLAMLFLLSVSGMAQTSLTAKKPITKNKTTMKMYVIEREIPGVGKFTPEQLKSASQTSCKVLNEMGPKIEWIQSYVTGNKLYCVYRAENEELVREHARKGGFPANSINEVSGIISPATAQGN